MSAGKIKRILGNKIVWLLVTVLLIALAIDGVGRYLPPSYHKPGYVVLMILGVIAVLKIRR